MAWPQRNEAPHNLSHGGMGGGGVAKHSPSPEYSARSPDTESRASMGLAAGSRRLYVIGSPGRKRNGRWTNKPSHTTNSCKKERTLARRGAPVVPSASEADSVVITTSAATAKMSMLTATSFSTGASLLFNTFMVYVAVANKRVGSVTLTWTSN
jgi:hypothetical protein